MACVVENALTEMLLIVIGLLGCGREKIFLLREGLMECRKQRLKVVVIRANDSLADVGDAHGCV